MHVCILANIFPARSETFVAKHALNLYRRGYTVSVISDTSEADSWSLLEEAASTIRERHYQYNLPKNKVSRAICFPSMFFRIFLRSRKLSIDTLNFFKHGDDSLFLKLPFLLSAANSIGPIDILHCHFGPNGLLGAYLKRVSIARYLVVTFHGGDLSKGLTLRWRRRYKVLFRSADLLLPVSQHWHNVLLTLGAPESHTIVHRLGVDINRYSLKAKSGAPKDTIKIVTVARLVEKKGIRYAIEAIAIVKKNNPDIHIHYDVAGAGALYRDLYSLTKRLGVTQTVQLHGALDHDEIEDLLVSADMFVLPSVTTNDGDQEGIPVALMEAMAIGLPVISTWHSGIPELVENNYSGYLVNERDVIGLADKIHWLTRNPDVATRCGLNARRQIENFYNAEIQTSRLLELYRGITQGRSRAPT